MPQDILTKVIRPFNRARELAVAKCFLHQPRAMFGVTFIHGHKDNPVDEDYDSLLEMEYNARNAKIEFKRKHNIQ
jgi:hypothetical protein